MPKTNKQKELKRHEKFRKRKAFLRVASVILLAFVTILLSPFYMGAGKVSLTRSDTEDVANNAKLYRMSSTFNPKTGYLVSEFYVGNKQDVNDLSAEKALSNIKYATRAQIQHGSMGNKPRFVSTRFRKINDHYFIIEARGIEPGYNVIRYDVIPQLIDSKVETDGFTKNSLIKKYARENQIKIDTTLKPESKSAYAKNYLAMIIETYTKKIKSSEKKIAIAQATIDRDDELIRKMNRKKAIASSSQKEDIDSQIADYKQDIDNQKGTIKEAKNTINEQKENIKATKNGAENF